MALRDDLLAPIPGDSRGGVNLRNDPLFDRVREARREVARIALTNLIVDVLVSVINPRIRLGEGRAKA